MMIIQLASFEAKKVSAKKKAKEVIIGGAGMGALRERARELQISSVYIHTLSQSAYPA